MFMIADLPDDHWSRIWSWDSDSYCLLDEFYPNLIASILPVIFTGV